MKVFALMFVFYLLIFAYSLDDITQQVTLSCPVNPESYRGPANTLGKHGSKNEAGSMGEYNFNNDSCFISLVFL